MQVTDLYGPHTAYVDDVNQCQDLLNIMPSLEHLIADITHVMRRFSETLAPHHDKAGESGAWVQRLSTISLGSQQLQLIVVIKLRFLQRRSLVDNVCCWCLNCLAASFMQELSRAIYVNLPKDEEALRAFHSGTSKQAMGLEALNSKGPAYWNTRVRRMVKEPADLKQELAELMTKYRGEAGLDSQGRALLTESTEQVLQATKELIDKGSFCGELVPQAAALSVVG